MAAKDNIKGITVEIGGDTTGLNDALKDTESTSKNIQSELKSVNALLKFDPENTVALTQKQELLGKSVEAAAEKVRILKEAQEQVDEQFAKGEIGEQAYRSFQREVEFAEQALVKAETAVKDFSDEAGGAEKNVEELAEGVDDSGEAAEDAEGKFSNLGSTVAGVGAALAAGVAAVGAAVLGIGTALVGASEDAARYADDMLTLSTNTGLSAETLQAYNYAAELVDVSLDSLTSSMAKNIKSMNAAREGASETAVDMEKLEKAQTKAANAALAVESAQIKYDEAIKKSGEGSAAAQQAAIALEKAQNNLAQANRDVESAMLPVEGKSNAMAEAYEKLGVSVENADGTLRDGETVYWEIIDALGEMEEGSERDAIAMQILGKSAQDLNSLIAVGSEGIAEFTEEAYAMGAVMSEENLEALGNLEDGMQRLSSTMSAAKNNIGLIATSALTEYYEGAAQIAGNFSKLVNTVLSGDEITDEMISSFSESIVEMVEGVTSEIPRIIEVVSTIVTAVIEAIMQALPDVVNAITDFLPQLLAVVTEMLPQLVEAATQIVLAIVAALIEALPSIVEAGIEIITSLISGIADALPKLIPAAVGAVMAIVQTLIDNLPALLEAALEIIVALAEGILEALPVLIEALPAIIVGIIDFIIGAIPQIIEAGIKLLTSLIDALPKIISAIVKAIPQIIEGLINAILSNLFLIIEAGMTLFLALIDALPKIIIEIVKAIPQIMGSIVSAITGNIGQIIAAGIVLFVSLISSLPKIILEIVKAVPEIIFAIVEAFTKQFSKITEVGENLIKGLWEGISKMANWIGDKISGFCEGIVNGFKWIFGIASPSKVFRDEIGMNLAAGIGEGFMSEMNRVSDMMHKAVPTDFSTEVNAAYNASNAALIRQPELSEPALDRGGDTYNLHFDTINFKDLDELLRIAKDKRVNIRMGYEKG